METLIYYWPLSITITISVMVLLSFIPLNLWITALFSGVRLGFLELVFMHIRKVPPHVIVESLITATKAGLKVMISEIETHYLAGGNVPLVVRASLTLWYYYLSTCSLSLGTVDRLSNVALKIAKVATRRSMGYAPGGRAGLCW